MVFTPDTWPVDLKGDLYRPDSEGKAPAVLLLHGSGKGINDGRWLMSGIARKLAKRGYVVFNITYRAVPEWMYPDPLVDAQRAVRWMRENADEYGIDPERIATFGYSSGGYIGALAALQEGDDDVNVRAVVAGGAPTNMTYYKNSKLMDLYLGSWYEEDPELYWEASSVNHVTKDSPPFFLYHGTEDQLVHPDHLLEMEKKLSESGVPHEVYWLHGMGHLKVFLFPGQAIDRAIDFLDRQLK